MQLDLENRCVIVTGGASNIGRAAVLQFAAEGANVVIADIDLEAAETLARLVDSRGSGNAIAVQCDVTNRDDADRLVETAVEKFGVPDVLVNNVGWSEHRLFVEKDWAVAEREVDLNLWGTLYVTKAVLPGMLKRESGRVICISSDAGKTGEYTESIYSAAKAGVMGFVRTLAREVGRHGITVNGVCPSMTLPESSDEVGAHSMHRDRDHSEEFLAKVIKRYPLRRVGRPSEVANLIVFLGSDAGSFITGQNISVNGGYTM
ncbi:SDR family NAD(P)-dependent oxidoreductase [Diaminobutyricimonas sp. LJ205]|uniref:SDR family NAD(P)-dependent oxidoreductase n=1 Tax=Diaminobutyricimonas sp. LJ205 TaxID=2683590 RepID=UPI0012F4E4F8|nr:SDR family NAD(P)-dependent oxidoreductase [Diaminobutyricimonas sp. LJ205]